MERSPERDLLPMARNLDIGVTAWSPLGVGVLSGKYSNEIQEQKRFDPNNPMTSGFVNERNLSIAKEVQIIATEKNNTPSQVALSWLRHRSDRGVIIPIVGARSRAQMRDNLGSLDVDLSPDQLKRLDDISKIELGFPHDFFNEDGVRLNNFGGFYEQVEKRS